MNTLKNFCQACGRKYEEIEEEGILYDGDDNDPDQEDDLDFWDDWEDDNEDVSLDSEPRARRSTSKKNIQERTDTGVLTGTPTRKSDIQLIAEAIQIHEGWIPPNTKNPRGSTSFRNNNPGNLKFVGQREAIGKDERGFAIFPSVEAGKRALHSDLNAKFTRNPNLTIEGLISVYAPASDDNDEQSYVNFIKQYIAKNK